MTTSGGIVDDVSMSLGRLGQSLFGDGPLRASIPSFATLLIAFSLLLNSGGRAFKVRQRRDVRSTRFNRNLLLLIALQPLICNIPVEASTSKTLRRGHLNHRVPREFGGEPFKESG